jgi:23S rRNA (cytidine1920-2'-O)/16S rRNA (cytidine1409-2'-O)-methyltransferase
MSSGKSRLDVALVDRGLFDSREKARRAIMAAQVFVEGQPATKAGTLIPPHAKLAVASKEKFVGRGGYKIEAALDFFHIDPAGRVCADIGASTGGFTDCLLQRGALKVFALDVGHGQLDWRLRQDPRVDVREGVNARYLQPSDLDPPPTLAVADVSFISLTLIFPAVFALLPAESDMVVLIKPQFELSKAEVGRGGVVREEALRIRAVEKIRTFIKNSGHRWAGSITSPITGRDGNVEFLAHLKP